MGTVVEGTSNSDITISVSDDVFMDLADGKITGQKAFMGGKLKVKGNMMLAMRLDSLFKAIPKATSKTQELGSKKIFEQLSLNLASLGNKQELIKKVFLSNVDKRSI